MKTRVWPLDKPRAAVDVEHEKDECCYCVAARLIDWHVGDVAFIESEHGPLHRVECVFISPSVVKCEPTTRELALAEIEGD